MTLRIEYGDAVKDVHFEELAEPDQLIEKIEAIKRRFEPGLEAPYGVDVVNESGDRMTVAFDDREGLLMLQPGEESKQFSDNYYSLGDTRRSDDRIFHLPEWTEVSGKYMVPTRNLKEAVRHWAKSGKLGDQIHWTNELQWSRPWPG